MPPTVSEVSASSRPTKARLTSRFFRAGTIVWLWLRFNGIWLVPLVISIILGLLWIGIGAVSQESQLTDRVDMAPYGFTSLQLAIQHPTRLTLGAQSADAQIVVFPSGHISKTEEPVELIFTEPSGMLNFVDPEGRVTDGRVAISATNGRPLPSEFYLRNAGVRTRQSRILQVRTSIQASGQAEIPIPELDLAIAVEHPVEMMVREFVHSTTGSAITLLAIAGALFGFVRKAYVTRRRIAPYIVELDRLNELHRWDEVADLCDRILAIDPFYDRIGDRLNRAREQARQQEQEFYNALLEAKSEFEQGHYVAARQLLLPLIERRPDHHPVRELMEQIDTQIKKQEEGQKQVDKGRDAFFQGELGRAKAHFRRAQAIDPRNETAAPWLQTMENLAWATDTDTLTPETLDSVRGSKWIVAYTVQDVPSLARILAQPNIDEAAQSALALASGKGFSPFLPVLDHEDPLVRRNAALVLGYIGDPRVGQHLRPMLQDRDPGVRRAAGAALLQLADVEELVAELANNETWHQARQILLEKSVEAIPDLVIALGQEWPVWERAAGILFDMGESIRPHLLQLAQDKRPTVQHRIDAVLNALTEALEDSPQPADAEMSPDELDLPESEP